MKENSYVLFTVPVNKHVIGPADYSFFSSSSSKNSSTSSIFRLLFGNIFYYGRKLFKGGIFFFCRCFCLGSFSSGFLFFSGGISRCLLFYGSFFFIFCGSILMIEGYVRTTIVFLIGLISEIVVVIIFFTIVFGRKFFLVQIIIDTGSGSGNSSCK